MEAARVDELRTELNRLLRRQTAILQSRALRTATDTEVLEYEIRQDVIHEICDQLARSVAL
jgi:hypothetical protein